MISEDGWECFSRDGYLHLGQVLSPVGVEELKQRADDLAMGLVQNPDVQMQLDTGGAYEALPQAVAQFEQGTRLYRKIQGLETDPLYLKLIKTPLFLEACGRIYGRHAAISIFRAMIMNKPAGRGTVLPWHQDGGNVWAIDRDPLVTIWVALDPATRENGCMECIPGSHHLGLLSQFGSTVAEENVKLHCPPEKTHPLEVAAGHAVLIHNWLIHRSGVNPSPVPRRAFTMCCMDGRTRSLQTGNHFPLISGSLPEGSDHYFKLFQQSRADLERSVHAATAYARSLEVENQTLRQMREEAERYALSLEAAEKARIAASEAKRAAKAKAAA